MFVFDFKVIILEGILVRNSLRMFLEELFLEVGDIIFSVLGV